MYNLLIVDDEMIAVRAIAKGIDWSSLPIGTIREAYDYDEAVAILEQEPIHVLITDIEMPDRSGIELLQFARERYPDILSVVTTGHAQFDYAQKALQFGSLNYLLKPIDFAELKTLVAKAMDILEERKQSREFETVFHKYEKQWNQQLPILRERFWQDVLNQRMRPTGDQLASALEMYDIPVRPDTPVLPVLISLEEWGKELSARDEEIMEYALRNAAEELILGRLPGQALQERNGTNILLVYGADGSDTTKAGAGSVAERCEAYIRQCGHYFRCSVSCYVGDWTPIELLPTEFRMLLQMERGNLTRVQSVLTRTGQPAAATVPFRLPDFVRWQTLLETGRKEAFLGEHEQWFDAVAESSVDAKALQAFYLAYSQVVYQTAQAKGLPPADLPSLHQPTDTSHSPLRSFRMLRQWSYQAAEELLDVLRQRYNVQSSVVAEATAYIRKHIADDLSREAIAAHVHLNAAYFSRLFKKETSVSLTDYIVNVRVELAKELLRDPEIKISTVAESAGYTHLSHFAKMFKRIVGQTPQDYRRGYLNKPPLSSPKGG